jgi:hypothetical protein
MPDYLDTSECGSSTYAQPQQQQHCLRQRIAVVGTGGSSSSSSSGAANVAAPGLAGDAAAPTEGGVAGMAFKESQQEVNLASACCMPATHPIMLGSGWGVERLIMKVQRSAPVQFLNANPGIDRAATRIASAKNTYMFLAACN